MAGGAWKVAYADFVTALMALFMVLWISAQDQEIIFKTVQYFKTPFGLGFSEGNPGGVGGGGQGSGNGSSDEMNINQQQEAKTAMVNLAFLHKLASDLSAKLKMEQSKDKDAVKVKVSSDGLHITIFDRENQPLFKKDTAAFTEWGEYMMQNLAWLIDRNDMQIKIGAHMPKGYKTDNPNYGPWELSLDRSNATRKLLESYSLKEDKIYQVSGFADTKPLPEGAQDLAENQRLEISLIM